MVTEWFLWKLTFLRPNKHPCPISRFFWVWSKLQFCNHLHHWLDTRLRSKLSTSAEFSVSSVLFYSQYDWLSSSNTAKTSAFLRDHLNYLSDYHANAIIVDFPVFLGLPKLWSCFGPDTSFSKLGLVDLWYLLACCFVTPRYVTWLAYQVTDFQFVLWNSRTKSGFPKEGDWCLGYLLSYCGQNLQFASMEVRPRPRSLTGSFPLSMSKGVSSCSDMKYPE